MIGKDLTGAKCIVCGNEKDFQIKYKKPDYFIVECKSCSFIFIPSEFRKSVKYSDYKDEKVLEQIRRGNNWIKIQRHKLRFKTIRKFIKKGELFDLGSGWGHFMYTGKLLGFHVSGIELAKTPYIYAKEDLKLPVEKIDFFEMKLTEQKFDIITMWDVLEHIDNADEAIEKCGKMLKTGGFLVIQVPQIDSYIAKKQKENWKMIGLDHVNYFSKKTIRLLFEKYNFKVLKIKSSVELKLFLMYTVMKWKKEKKATGKNISSAERQEYYNKTVNKPMWMLRIFVFFHNILYNILSFLGIGEEMIVVAKKIK